MRLSVWALAALLLGAFAAHFVLQDRGYVLINFRGYSIEMSVPALVLVLLAAYMLVRFAAGVLRTPRKVGTVLAERRQRRSGSRLALGLKHLAEGDLAKGERLLTRGLKSGEAPLVNYLMAARAAQLQGSRQRRDEWLKLAYERLPDSQTAVLLTQAELQIDGGEHERALRTLQPVRDATPAHPVVIALTAKACAALGDSRQLAELLPQLGRARLEPQVREDIAVAALRALAEAADLTVERLRSSWKTLPSQIRRTPRVIVLKALALERLGRGDEAERELRGTLKRRWEAPLVAAYGQVRAADPARQLQQAENWLKNHPEDAVLLLTAARLSMLNELWGKARSYLESSLAIDPAPESYAVYGRLLDRLGENESAALAFRSGLALVDGADAELPALAAPNE